MNKNNISKLITIILITIFSASHIGSVYAAGVDAAIFMIGLIEIFTLAVTVLLIASLIKAKNKLALLFLYLLNIMLFYIFANNDSPNMSYLGYPLDYKNLLYFLLSIFLISIFYLIYDACNENIQRDKNV